MGVFNSKIKTDEGLEQAFGQFPSGVSLEKAEAMWATYDSDGNGTLDREEAKKMVCDLAEHTIGWAKQNLAALMSEAHTGPDVDTQTLIEEHQHNIDNAYKLMKDPAVVEQIIHDFDTDGDGEISKDEFLAKATEGYDLFRPQKRAKKLALHVAGKVKAGGKDMVVQKELVGPSVYVNIEGFYGVERPFCCATIAPGGFVSVSSTYGFIPGSERLAEGGVAAETTQCLENIKVILLACGCHLENLLKVSVYLKDNDGNNAPGGRFYEMNEAYKKFFSSSAFPGKFMPARLVLEAGKITEGAQVVIDVQAHMIEH